MPSRKFEYFTRNYLKIQWPASLNLFKGHSLLDAQFQPLTLQLHQVLSQTIPLWRDVHILLQTISHSLRWYGVEVSMGKCGELCGFDVERWTGTGHGVLTYPALNKHKHCSRSSYPPSKKCSSVCVCFCVFLCIYGVTIFRIFIQKLTSLYALVYGIQLW